MPEQPAPPPPPPAPNIDIRLDLSALADLIWQAFVERIPDLGAAIWEPFANTLREAAWSVWNAAWGSSANLVTQLPLDLTLNFGPYRAVAGDPTALAIGGAMLAIVLLGLRTMVGALVGSDHVVTHVTGRLIPATAVTLAYPLVIGQGVGILNQAATGLGSVNLGQALMFSAAPSGPLGIAYALLWLLLIYYGVRLLIRLAYSLFRFLVALLFGPVALMRWAIPQTEWITELWLRELVGWGTTPLLVTACLVLGIPLAAGREEFLSAAVFGIASLQAAYDLAGLLAFGRAWGGNLMPRFSVRQAAGAMAGGGAGAAAASTPAMRSQLLADQYGFR